MVSTPNYKSGIGRLVADRFDFQSHIDGYPFRHKADQIDLNPPLVIDGYTKYTTQSALELINTLVGAPTYPDATASSKGMVQLSGDIGGLGGTATNVKVSGLQGVSVLSTAPTNGQLLQYNSGTWGPATVPSFTAGGDLSGGISSQQVLSASGSSNIFKVNCNYLEFSRYVSGPAIYQRDESTGAGRTLTIAAQNATALFPAMQRGGNLNIISGFGYYNGGSVNLLLGAGATSYMVEAKNIFDGSVGIGSRTLALLGGTGTSSGNVPSGCGDMVIFIKDAVIAPTTGIPSGGTLLYSSGGKLRIKQSDASDFVISRGAVLYYTSAAVAFNGDYSAYQTITGSTSYVDVTSMDISLFTAFNAGDMIRAHFHGHFKHDGYTYGALIKIIVTYGATTVEIPGTEVILDNDLTGKTMLMSMAGIYQMPVSAASARVKVQAKVMNGTDHLYVFKGMSLIVDAFRP